MKFKKLVAILLVTISMISVLGGCGVTKHGESKEKEIAQKIAKDFSNKYIDPDGNIIQSITFFESPKYSNDFTDDVTYKFYINDNKEWIVGASVKEKSGEIWAYGSDVIELDLATIKIEVEDLKVSYWESE